MPDKIKVKGKKYVAHCKCHGWLTKDELVIKTTFKKKEDEKNV